MGLVIIRADASTTIGGGHIYRCLTLADQLCERGFAVHFICRAEPGHLQDLIKQRGYRSRLLNAEQVINESDDALGCRDLLQHTIVEFGPIAVVIVDHYQLGTAWQRQISPLTQHLAVIDDLANRPYHCDLLFDQSLARVEQDYPHWLDDRCTEVITGAQYALLRPQFLCLQQKAKQRRATTHQVRTILVAIGATDPDNVTLKVLQQLAPLIDERDLNLEVVLTSKAPHIEQVKSFIDQYQQRIRLNLDVSDMATLMLHCDIAIAAAGTSMLERCCLGLPSVIICVAANQNHIAQAMYQQQAAIAVMDKAQVETQLASVLLQWLASPEHYAQVANNAFSIFDGRLSDHLANRLQALAAQPSVWLQPVTNNHCSLIYQWQLVPTTRQFARDPNPPTLEQHQQWFSATLADPNICFYLIMQAQQACGFVRLNPSKDHDDKYFEVSIALAPEAYGLGLGSTALRSLAQLHPEKRLLAYISPLNQASVNAFGKAGFIPTTDHWYQLTRTTDDQ